MDIRRIPLSYTRLAPGELIDPYNSIKYFRILSYPIVKSKATSI